MIPECDRSFQSLKNLALIQGFHSNSDEPLEPVWARPRSSSTGAESGQISTPASWTLGLWEVAEARAPGTLEWRRSAHQKHLPDSPSPFSFSPPLRWKSTPCVFWASGLRRRNLLFHHESSRTCDTIRTRGEGIIKSSSLFPPIKYGQFGDVKPFAGETLGETRWLYNEAQ